MTALASACEIEARVMAVTAQSIKAIEIIRTFISPASAASGGNTDLHFHDYGTAAITIRPAGIAINESNKEKLHPKSQIFVA